MDGDLDLIKCTMCGNTYDSKHKICPSCKGYGDKDENSKGENPSGFNQYDTDTWPFPP